MVLQGTDHVVLRAVLKIIDELVLLAIPQSLVGVEIALNQVDIVTFSQCNELLEHILLGEVI